MEQILLCIPYGRKLYLTADLAEKTLANSGKSSGGAPKWCGRRENIVITATSKVMEKRFNLPMSSIAHSYLPARVSRLQA